MTKSGDKNPDPAPNHRENAQLYVNLDMTDPLHFLLRGCLRPGDGRVSGNSGAK